MGCISNDWETFKEIFTILKHQGNSNQNYLRFHITPVRINKIKKEKNMIVHAVLDRAIVIPLHSWWKSKLIQPLWKSLWWFLRKLDIHLFQDHAILSLGIPIFNPEDIYTWYPMANEKSFFFKWNTLVVYTTCQARSDVHE